MRDREMVAAIVAGDLGGLAAAYDRYATALNTYCLYLLGEPADAADAVQDTFVIAVSKLSGLRDRDRLKPWLYAVARNECLRRIRTRSSSVEIGAADDMTDESGEVGDAVEREELRDLVRAAVDGLNPGEREVIELSLRHDLENTDIAAALGVTGNHAHALLSRARGQLERAIGALLVARRGRGECAELDALLSGWDGRLTILMRKRINRHIEHCDVCGERRRREFLPTLLLCLAPVAALDPAFRDELIRLVGDHSAAGVARRAELVRRAGEFDAHGFPHPLHPPARPLAHLATQPRRLAAISGGAAAVGAAAAALIIAATQPHTGPHVGSAAPRGGSPASPTGPYVSSGTSASAPTTFPGGGGAGAPGGGPSVTGPTSTAAGSDGVSPTAPAGATGGGPGPGGGASSTSTTSGGSTGPTGPTGGPTTTTTTAPPTTATTPPTSPPTTGTTPPPPPPGTLLLSASVVVLTPIPPLRASVTLTASAGPVSGITVTSDIDLVTVTSSDGWSLPAGGSTTLDIHAALPIGTALLTVNPGGQRILVIDLLG